jgi:superfamily II DNA helicase RecQ
MQLQFFRIPIHAANAADELNRFLSTHRVSSIDRQFVADGPNSVWSICVTYETGDPPRPSTKSKERIDYREVLPEEQFRIFAKLRVLRKEFSERDEVPAYTVFNNEHLAEIVRRHVTTKDELAKISGVGQVRIEKYSEPFLEIMRVEPRPVASDSAAEPNQQETPTDS